MTIHSGGTFAPGTPGVPGTSMTITGNLAFQSGAIYLVQLNPTTAILGQCTGHRDARRQRAGGVCVGQLRAEAIHILHAIGGSAARPFPALGTTNLPTGFSASLSYTPTTCSST